MPEFLGKQMSIDKKLREILENVYSCDVRSDKQDKNRIIDQAIFAIKEEYIKKDEIKIDEEMLPKEESQPILEDLRDVANRNIIWENGRIAGKNQCLTEIKSKMNKDRK